MVGARMRSGQARHHRRLSEGELILSMMLIAVLPLSLKDTVERMVSDGPEARAIASEVPVARSEVTTAGMIPNPTVGASAAFVEPIFSAFLQLRLPIFGQRGAHVRAAEAGVQASQASVDRQRWLLRRQARGAYYAAVRADAEVEIARELEGLTAQVAHIAEARLDAGTGSRLEQQQATLLHARARQDVLGRQSDARRARIELGRLLGDPTAATAPLSDPLERVGPTAPLDSLLQAAAQTHPDLLASLAAVAAAQARAAAARSELRPLPVLELGGDLLEHSTCATTAASIAQHASSGGRCFSPHLGLSFDLPLFNWNRGPVQRALAEQARENFLQDAARVRIEAQVRSAFDGWSAAKQRAAFFDEEFVPVAASVEAMAREGFATGKSGLIPLLEAERAVLEARIGRAEAFAGMQAARAELEEVSGVAHSLP